MLRRGISPGRPQTLAIGGEDFLPRLLPRAAGIGRRAAARPILRRGDAIKQGKGHAFRRLRFGYFVAPSVGGLATATVGARERGASLSPAGPVTPNDFYDLPPLPEGGAAEPEASREAA